jgi:hypothetical protein
VPYTKTVWATGDLITKVRLNKIETGIETAQGDIETLFEVSGNNGVSGSLGSGLASVRQEIRLTLPAGQVLTLIRTRFHLGDLDLRLEITAGIKYSSSISSGEETPNLIIRDNSAGTEPVQPLLTFTIRNSGETTNSMLASDGWWAQLRIR